MEKNSVQKNESANSQEMKTLIILIIIIAIMTGPSEC